MNGDESLIRLNANMEKVPLAVNLAICFILLVVGLGSQQVRADGRMAGIKGLFCGKSTYETFANHLYGATKSNQLGDNIKEAASLLSQHSDANEELTRLVNVFISLKDNTDEKEITCSEHNLANLRELTEAMSYGGNLGPKKITEPIRRLNEIVLTLINTIRPICIAHLASRWPSPWKPNFSSYKVHNQINKLSSLPRSFLYEGYFATDDPHYDAYNFANRLDHVLKNSLEWNADRRLEITQDKSVIGKQLQEFVLSPCSEFVKLDETNSVLKSYDNLYVTYNSVMGLGMNKFCENNEACTKLLTNSPYKPVTQDKSLDALARSFRACIRLLPMNEKKLIKSVISARQIAQMYRDSANRRMDRESTDKPSGPTVKQMLGLLFIGTG